MVVAEPFVYKIPAERIIEYYTKEEIEHGSRNFETFFNRSFGKIFKSLIVATFALIVLSTNDFTTILGFRLITTSNGLFVFVVLFVIYLVVMNNVMREREFAWRMKSLINDVKIRELNYKEKDKKRKEEKTKGGGRVIIRDITQREFTEVHFKIMAFLKNKKSHLGLATPLRHHYNSKNIQNTINRTIERMEQEYDVIQRINGEPYYKPWKFEVIDEKNVFHPNSKIEWVVLTVTKRYVEEMLEIMWSNLMQIEYKNIEKN